MFKLFSASFDHVSHKTILFITNMVQFIIIILILLIAWWCLSFCMTSIQMSFRLACVGCVCVCVSERACVCVCTWACGVCACTHKLHSGDSSGYLTVSANWEMFCTWWHSFLFMHIYTAPFKAQEHPKTQEHPNTPENGSLSWACNLVEASIESITNYRSDTTHLTL